MTFSLLVLGANLILRQNLNPAIAIGINNMAKNTEDRITQAKTITNKSGNAIILGILDVNCIGLRQ